MQYLRLGVEFTAKAITAPPIFITLKDGRWAWDVFFQPALPTASSATPQWLSMPSGLDQPINSW
jgi:hypothetical protein